MYPKSLSWKQQLGFYLLNCTLEDHPFTIKVFMFTIISRVQLVKSEQAGVEPLLTVRACVCRRKLLHPLLDLLLLFLKEMAEGASDGGLRPAEAFYMCRMLAAPCE